MNLEEDLLKYIERFKKKKGNNEIFDKYIKIYLVGNEIIKHKNKKIDIKKLITKYKLNDPKYIDIIITYSKRKDKSISNLYELIIELFYENDYNFVYEKKIQEIKDKSKKININIIESNNKDNLYNLNENILKLFNDENDIEIFSNMIKNTKIDYISDLDKLIDSKFLIPITIEFNRYHKSNYKTKNLKNETRSSIINNEINDIKKSNLEKKKFIDINNTYTVIYNKLEIINILNRFLTDDFFFIKNIENRDSYIELKKNNENTYFNFNNNYNLYTTNKKCISIRKTINNSYDNKIEIRNIKKNEEIDIYGFILTNEFKTIIHTKNIKNVKEVINFNKNLKNIFNKNLIFLNEKTDINIFKIFAYILKFLKKYIVKKRLTHKYPNLFDKKEKELLTIYNFYHSKRNVNNNVVYINIINKSQKQNKLIVKENDELFRNYIYLFRDKNILDKTKKYIYSELKTTCIHLIELKEMNDLEYIINKYAKYENNFFMCKYCNAIILNNSDISTETIYNEYSMDDNTINDRYMSFENDIILIKTKIQKIFEILKITYLFEKNIKYLLNDLMILIGNQIKDLKSDFFVEDELNDGYVFIMIVIILLLSKPDIINFYKIDNICNYNIFKNNNNFFNKLLINDYNLFQYKTLSFCIFNISCCIIKYILNVEDKIIFNKKIKQFCFKYIFYMNKIINDKNKIYDKYRNIFFYKLNVLYNIDIEIEKKQKRKQYVISNSNFKYDNFNKKINYNNLFLYQKLNHKIKKSSIDIKTKYNLKYFKKEKQKKKEKNIFKINNHVYNTIPKNTLSYLNFINKYKIKDENVYYIDFDLNGYNTDNIITIKYKDIFISKKNERSYLSIFNSFLNCYMYFDIYYLYYIGYSTSKNIEKIINYENQFVYLKIKFSLKNKFKYLGHTNIFYHINIYENIYETINKNINEILKKLHIIMNILKFKVIQKKTNFKYQTKINQFLKNNKSKIVYDNQFNIKFDIYKKKLNEKKIDKSIIFIKDVFDNNDFSTIYLQYIYYIFDYIISKNKNIKDILFTFIDEIFDTYFINNNNNEYKNNYKIYYDCYDQTLQNTNTINQENIDITDDKYIEQNDNTFDYNEIDIEENPFDNEE